MTIKNDVIVYTPTIGHFIRYYLEWLYVPSAGVIKKLFLWPIHVYYRNEYFLSERCDLYQKISQVMVVLNIFGAIGILWFINIWLALVVVVWFVVIQIFSVHTVHHHIKSYVKMKKPMRLKCLPGARYRFECKKNGTLMMKMVNGERMLKWKETK